MPLCRVLSKMGFASRTVGRSLVKAGRVTVDGQLAENADAPVDPILQRVAVDGKPLGPQRRVVLAMNKPEGVLTTFHDPQGRPTVYGLLPKMPGWVFPVGRLDAKSTGLLIFTNDPRLGEILTNHRYGIPKTYEVKARGTVSDEAVQKLRDGVMLDDGLKTLPARVRVVKHNPGTTWLEIVLTEGRNRQVRRMLEAVGHKVDQLRRVRIGGVDLGMLEAGKIRFLSDAEIRLLRSRSNPLAVQDADS